MIIGVAQVMGINPIAEIRFFRFAHGVRGQCLQLGKRKKLADQSDQRRASDAGKQLSSTRPTCLQHGLRHRDFERLGQVLLGSEGLPLIKNVWGLPSTVVSEGGIPSVIPDIPFCHPRHSLCHPRHF